MGDIRIGVLGAGWGAGLHVEGYRAAAGAELTAIASRTRERAQQLAERYGIGQVAGSAEELIDAVDVVSVATPPDSHHQLVLAAAAAGRHVLCDKPLALTADQAQKMVDAVRTAGVRHATGFIWRGDPALAHMREMIAGGDIGRPLEIHSTCALGVPVLPMNWMYEAQSGGGALAQHGSHVIDRARWLLGEEIVEVNGGLLYDVAEAVAAQRFHHVMDVFAWAREHRGGGEGPRRPVTADTGYEFRAVFSNGTRGRFWEAWHRPGPAEDQVVVDGENGTLEWSGAGGVRLHRMGKDPRPIDVPGAAASGAHTPREVGIRHWQELAGRFIAAIRDGADSDHPTLLDGCQVAAVSDAVRRSDGSGRWEKVQ